ncbi:DUF4334 domain-containing protein [Blastococcus sp. CT_GayMR16]|uniref:DUF4334 domain-containing protein n=1 Tax=Blastococcus sp. CT_GayMR16 TaxID=2559607 RepID=UPI0010741172|nr:DUF4334 domain-containing protein [Blastococcus sp. CT_GayMR16]TFV86808.1 DUF4334 domain-containing protein [Blastococcus sp. CT_GayMR16]
MTTTDDVRAADWLDTHRDGARPEEALAYFDSLPVVEPKEMLGRWRGSGLPTGSPLDGLLEAYGWYGKEFLDDESVHPLLFTDRSGRPRPVDPSPLPIGLLRDYAGFLQIWPLRVAFTRIRPLLYTGKPKARLREVTHRGVVTAALVYDALPIIDVFRRVSDDVRLGAMDMRGLPSPFLFVLRRDDSG